MNFELFIIIFAILFVICVFAYLIGYHRCARELERFFKKYGNEDEGKKKKWWRKSDDDE